VRVADVDRPDVAGVEQGEDAPHLVLDVTKAAGLLPSPWMVRGRPARAWTMRFDTTRPSSGRVDSPRELKIRTMRTSVPWWRWYAMVMASAKRLASS